MIFLKWLLFILVFIQCYLIFLRSGTFALSLATVHFQRFRIEASQKMEYKGSSIISWSKYHLKVNNHWISNTNRGKRNRSNIIIIIWKEVENQLLQQAQKRDNQTTFLYAAYYLLTFGSVPDTLYFAMRIFFLLWVFFSPSLIVLPFHHMDSTLQLLPPSSLVFFCTPG